MTRTARSTRSTRPIRNLLRGCYACLGLISAYGLHLTVTALTLHPSGQAAAGHQLALVTDQLLLVIASVGLYRHYRTAPGPMCWASYLAAAPSAAYVWLAMATVPVSASPLALTVFFANAIASCTLVTFGHHCSYTRRKAEADYRRLREEAQR